MALLKGYNINLEITLLRLLHLFSIEYLMTIMILKMNISKMLDENSQKLDFSP